MSTNPIASIKQDFVRDHSKYLNHYIDQMIRNVPADCVAGIRKIKTYRDLLGKLTVQYPRIISYMSNPDEASKIGVTLDSIKEEMAIQSGVSKDGDGEHELNEMQNVITDIRSIISRVKKIDLSTAKECAIDIMAALDIVRTNLQEMSKIMSNVTTKILHPDTVLSNLLELRTKLTPLLEHNGSLNQLLSQIENRQPIRSFDDSKLRETREKLSSITEWMDGLNSMISSPESIVDDVKYAKIIDTCIENTRLAHRYLVMYRVAINTVSDMNDKVEQYLSSMADGLSYGPFRLHLRSDSSTSTNNDEIFKVATSETEIGTKLLAEIFGNKDLVVDIHRPNLSQISEDYSIEETLAQMKRSDLPNRARLQNIQYCLANLSEFVSSAKVIATQYDSIVARYADGYNRIYNGFKLLTLIATDQSLMDNFVIHESRT
jgi:hypothetical protein